MKKIVIISGAGISAESGISTFRDANGLWENHAIEDVASPEGWTKNPQLVLDFYNMRRKNAWEAQPNKAHLSLVELEEEYDVTIVTQNVDALHERAGSSNVIHLHGVLSHVRSENDASLRRCVNGEPVNVGDLAEDGYQLRPDIVWFGESVENWGLAEKAVKEADKVLVVGTSLQVYPAAGLVHYARYGIEKIYTALEIDSKPKGFDVLRGKATEILPHIVERWIREIRRNKPV